MGALYCRFAPHTVVTSPNPALGKGSRICVPSALAF